MDVDFASHGDEQLSGARAAGLFGRTLSEAVWDRTCRRCHEQDGQRRPRPGERSSVLVIFSTSVWVRLPS